MKTKSFYVASIMLGFIFWNCSKTDVSNSSSTQLSLKSALSQNMQDLTTAVNAITSSPAYQVLSGPADLNTKSAQISPLDTITHSILLADIDGIYDYKATSVRRGFMPIMRFFNKTAESTQMIVRLPEEKVKASRTLLHYTPTDTLLANNYIITLSDYQYRFSFLSGWTYQMASSTKIKNVDSGTLKIQSKNTKTAGYQFASQYNFPNGYITKCQYTSGDTAISDYAITNGTKTLYEEKYTAIKSKTNVRHRETQFSLTIGNVLILRELAPGKNSLDSAKVYVGGKLQLKSKVEIVDKTTDATDNCVTNQKRELKITFDDGTSKTFTELAGAVVTDITSLFASMRQAYFATGIIDWIAWDIYTKK